MFVGFKSTNKAFINFHDSTELVDVVVRAASLTQSAQHEPCGLPGNSDLPSQLRRTYALARGHQEVHDINPLVKRNMRSLEDCSGSDSEVEVSAGVATIEPSFARGNALAGFAFRADWTVGPNAAFEVLPRGFRIGEHLKQFEGADRRAAHGDHPASGAAHCAISALAN